MNRFEELIHSASARPDVIVHLGAGSCKEYEFFKTLGSSRIIFVEPDQALVKTANSKFINVNNVSVISRAVALENGRQVLRITNNRRFSSLLPPGELSDYYPNVEVTGEAEVEAVTLQKLCRDEGLSGESANLLVAELQGMEKEIFPDVEIDTLQIFNWIILRTSECDLYEPTSNRAPPSLVETMRNAGFTTLVFKEAVPPFINILCLRTDDSIQARSQIQSLNAEKDTQIQEIKKLTNSVVRKSDKLREARSEIQSLNAEKETRLRRIEELEDTINTKSSEASELQQTLRINNKLLLKSDTDLKDLQAQYRTALQHQEQQHALLCELKEKLQLAAEYYQKLNLQNLVLDGDMLEQSESDIVKSANGDEGEDQITK
jgi:FkbM family methyltransferase